MQIVRPNIEKRDLAEKNMNKEEVANQDNKDLHKVEVNMKKRVKRANKFSVVVNRNNDAVNREALKVNLKRKRKGLKRMKIEDI